MHKAVFIDRDGTLIKDVPYNSNPDLIQFEEYAIEMLQLLKIKNYLLIIVSNQAGVAKGFFKEEDVYEIHNMMQKVLSLYLIKIDAFYYCPHLIDGDIKEYAIECNCRKPKAGLLLKASEEINIDLNNSWMIGDILNDVEAGNIAGCRTILIDNGNETEWLLNENRIPEYWAKNLKEATETIIMNEMMLERNLTVL